MSAAEEAKAALQRAQDAFEEADQRAGEEYGNLIYAQEQYTEAAEVVTQREAELSEALAVWQELNNE